MLGVAPRALLVIGGSAGAIEALVEILPALPASFPAPVVVVLHLPESGGGVLKQILTRHSALPVQEAEDKAPLAPGTIFLAPPAYHLLIEKSWRLGLSQDSPEHHCRPSIDVLFESVADCAGADAVAVLLTGANDDGATGIAAVARAGGTTVVQDPASALSPEMPRAALALCQPSQVLPLQEIGPYLGRLWRAPVKQP
jgi:two-component system, chemotaxis family, protein-glutamate methylesterase/glutaminase